MSVKPPSELVEVARTTERRGSGKRPGHPQRQQASPSVAANPQSRSFAERDGALRSALTTGEDDRSATTIAARPIPPTILSEDTPVPPSAQPARMGSQPVSFQLSGPLTSGLLVYPPDRARPYWRDDHGHRFVLDQVLAGEPQQQRERILDTQAHAIFDLARALASARLAGEHTQVSALSHAASRLCNEMASRVTPNHWQPGR